MFFPISAKMRFFHLSGVICICQTFLPAETWFSHGGGLELNFKTSRCSRDFPQLWDVAALGAVRGAWSTLVLLRWLVDMKYDIQSNAAYHGNNRCMKIHRTAVSFILFTPAISLPFFFQWGFYSLFIVHGQDQPFPWVFPFAQHDHATIPNSSKGTFPGNGEHLNLGSFPAERPLP